MKNIYSCYILLLSLLFLAACAASPVQQEERQEQREERRADAPSEEVAVDADDVFYFDFDKSIIKPQAYIALDQHAETIKQGLSRDSNLLIIVEGHCDERGTDEYNIALGERRAQAVSRYLRVQGVPAENIETVSYGEERPVNPASNEAAWAQNRRAVLVY